MADFGSSELVDGYACWPEASSRRPTPAASTAAADARPSDIVRLVGWSSKPVTATIAQIGLIVTERSEKSARQPSP